MRAKTRKAVSSSICATGVPGLDEIFGGGLPRDRVYLVRGDPGVGKTTLALQFLLAGKAAQERTLYITLSETNEEILAVAKSHGWDLSGIGLFELSAMDGKLKGEADSTFFHPSEIELSRTTTIILEEIERVKPDRVVFDSLSEMRMLAENALRYRKQMLQLKQYFAGRKCTIIFLDDRSAGKDELQIESIAHGVIHLQRTSPEFGASRRQVNVLKMRGVRFREGFHDLVIEKGGLRIFPRLVAADHHKDFTREAFSSGVTEMDLLLGGGIDSGTSTTFMGPPGCGKSTLALQFALTALHNQKKVLCFLFDETRTTMLTRSAGLGMDIRPFLKSGQLTLQQIDPAEVSPGEFAHRIRQGVEQDGVEMVIIDSLNGYLNAMPEERFLNLQLHELLAYLGQQGIVTIMILAQQGMIGPMHAAVDLTYLADTVILLRYFEIKGAVKQAIAVVKKRTGKHERTIREISMGKGGMVVGPPLTEMRGVLTGVPTLGPANE